MDEPKSLDALFTKKISGYRIISGDSFDAKKRAKLSPAGEKLRNGYADGSHSEIEVSLNATWGPGEIRERGLKLLRFMESRWDFKFKNDEDREQLLFLNTKKETVTAPMENPGPSPN